MLHPLRAFQKIQIRRALPMNMCSAFQFEVRYGP